MFKTLTNEVTRQAHENWAKVVIPQDRLLQIAEQEDLYQPDPNAGSLPGTIDSKTAVVLAHTRFHLELWLKQNIRGNYLAKYEVQSGSLEPVFCCFFMRPSEAVRFKLTWR